MFCFRIVGAFCGNYSGHYLRRISAQYKAALSAALHAKTLQLGDFKAPKQGADLATLGEVDTQILYRAVLQVSDIWALPLQVVFCLGGLAYLLPWQALVVVVIVIIIVIPLTVTFVKSIAYWVARNMSAKDYRTKLIIEALTVMQSIKMHAWESTFVELVAERRASELKTVQNTAISTSGLVCCMQCLPSLLVLASFGVIVFLNQELTSDFVFASLLLFTMLNNSLIQISGLASMMQAIATSLKRIEMHLNLPEAKLSVFGGHPIQPHLPMRLECKELGWPGCSPLVTSGLLQINPGALTAITGGMGSGKSTVLLAILRHLEQRFSGLDDFKIGHVPQKPHLLIGSIRNNILFGKPYDAEWYAKVIHACCLEADFERLQNGDQTVVIGSSTLSGGQSARISLARAAYRRATIYLLDDPIAAIDVKVSSEIMRRLLGSNGLLARSTRIVCTTDTAVLQHADAIHELRASAINFRMGQTQVLEANIGMESPSKQEELQEVTENTRSDSCSRTLACYAIEAESFDAPLSSSAFSHDSITSTPPHAQNPILAYLLSARRSSWLKATSLLLLARGSSVMGTYVLKMMANDTSGVLLTRHLALFGLSTVTQIALFFCFVLALYKLCIVPAASKLHRDLTLAILSQGMSFFQTTQVGDILNLFTNDISRIDGSLNSSIASLMGQYTNLAFSCGVLVVSSPLSLGFTIPLLAATYRLQLVYLNKLRELRRLDASSRTPLLEYLQEAEKGRVAFATYKIAGSRLAQFNHYLEKNLCALFPLSCLDLWLGLRLEIASVILQIVALGFLLASGADSGTLGFVMTYLFQITTTLSYIAKIGAQCEVDAVSVARIDEYSRMSKKGEICLDHNTLVPYSDAGPDAAWPRSGKIEFISVSTRYRSDLPNCLDSVTLTIESGEKVAVIGRTGAGKSSLALSMLRMMDQTAGQILIDDVDVASTSLLRLRRSLAVMPQAQIVLASSVRKNLDPLGSHSDEYILQCLENFRLLNTISKLVGVETTTGDAFDSLLDGENQIISLARAMIQNSKILVLDEATSGMDDSTETFVHDLIFDKLRDTSVLAIVHRLNMTVIT
ncbi:P-loop containing nucleoside triphosphate hydrolase protein, partial [Dactylonectria estremocensis]